MIFEQMPPPHDYQNHFDLYLRITQKFFVLTKVLRNLVIIVPC
jgi:hypothetical protein